MIANTLRASVMLGLLGGLVSPSHALVITQDTSASSLVNALLGGGGSGVNLGSVNATLSGQSFNSAASSGTYTNASGTYGIGDGIVLSTGNVSDYGDGPNTDTSKTTAYGVAATASEEALLDTITGGGLDHNDVTVLDITFDMNVGFTEIFFNLVFGSEEFPEFVGSDFIDGFGMFLNGTNISLIDALPINIDHPNMVAAGGTELDGVLGGSPGAFGPFVQTISGAVNPTGNQLSFIIGDSGDASLDTTVYISQFGGTPPPPPPTGVPVPATLALFGLGLAGLGFSRRKKA